MNQIDLMSVNFVIPSIKPSKFWMHIWEKFTKLKISKIAWKNETIHVMNLSTIEENVLFPQKCQYFTLIDQSVPLDNFYITFYLRTNQLYSGENKPEYSNKNPISKEINESKFECPSCKAILKTSCFVCSWRNVPNVKLNLLFLVIWMHLNAPMMSFHESDRPYECKICNSKFKVQQVLNPYHFMIWNLSLQFVAIMQIL